MLETLDDNLRREVVHYFVNIESDDTATLEELTAHIVRRVSDVNEEEVSIQLRHNHLPKLESNGWVEFDTRTQHIPYWSHDTAEALLTELAEMLSENPYPPQSN